MKLYPNYVPVLVEDALKSILPIVFSFQCVLDLIYERCCGLEFVFRNTDDSVPIFRIFGGVAGLCSLVTGGICISLRMS